MANIEGARVRIYFKDGLVILFEISFCRVYIFLQAKIIALETDIICLCYLRVSGSTAMRLAENGDPSTAIVCLTLFGPDTVNVMGTAEPMWCPPHLPCDCCCQARGTTLAVSWARSCGGGVTCVG